MKKAFKNESGFTLVELMIVVAIIGILSAVAVPNFKKYMAKSKTTEAKIQLAAAYTAEQGFYGDYGMYHSCLNYMGYNPAPEAANRYYTIGFSTAAAFAAPAAGNPMGNAVNSGLVLANCTNALAAADGITYFNAGKGSGGSISNNTYIPATALGTQLTGATQTFLMKASGVVSADFQAAGTASRISLNQNKVYQNEILGY